MADEKEVKGAKVKIVKPEAGKEVKPKAKAKSSKPKRLNNAQKAALEAVEAAQTMADLQAAVINLKPAERNDKRIGRPVFEATQQIVGKVVSL